MGLIRGWPRDGLLRSSDELSRLLHVEDAWEESCSWETPWKKNQKPRPGKKKRQKAVLLFGSGQIARGRQGEKGLLAPHILLTLGLGFCALCVSIYYAAMFSIYYAAINYGALLGVFDAAAHDRPLANPT